MAKRPTRQEWLWRLAFDAARRSTCDREHHGCVVARDGLVLVTGYNGSVDGDPHCDVAGHDLVSIIRKNGQTEVHCVRTIHAEQNAIINAALQGISIANCEWYITGIPCEHCEKMIARLHPERLYLCSDRGRQIDFIAMNRYWTIRRTDVTTVELLILQQDGIAPEEI